MDNITIIGKRWFDKINGNTYFSSVGLIDGEPKVAIKFEYGYGNQFEWDTFAELEKQGFINDVEHYKNGGSESLWRYCGRKGLKYYTSASDVNRKKDL